jgi:hypothetical protein
MKPSLNRGWLALQRERYGPDYRPPPEKNIHAVGDLVSGVLQDFGLANEWRIAELKQLWPDLVGKANAARSRPGRWENGWLTVYVSHHLWLNEMKRILPQALLKRLRTQYGEDQVQGLSFEMDPGPGEH